MKYIVTATTLNIRKGPDLNQPVIGSLKMGQAIEVSEESNADWWRINVPGSNLVGYVASRYLKAAPPVQPPVAPVLNPHNVIAVHYPVSNSSLRTSINARHTPLSENDLPFRTPASPTRNDDVHRIIQYLRVEQSPRYQPTSSSTFCNIYAYDFCYLSQAYLPRVWWNSKTLMEFARTPGYSPKPVYAQNVFELNANALYDWLDEWGDDFGWIRTYDLTDLQNKVNEGRVGVICAKRRDLSRSGHITCVVPEGNGQTASRVNAAVKAPLQSQAGSKNKSYFSEDWWVRLAAEFSASGFWYHD